MTKDEELEQLRHDNQILREALKEAMEAMSYLQERVKALEGQQAKDSHNSHLPPSSDRFVRAPKSLRQKSDKKPGGQPGHPGHHLLRQQAPDHLVVQSVETCEQCQQDLRGQAAQRPESRHVLDLPPQRLWVSEHRVEENVCPACGDRTRAAFPCQLRAPSQSGAGIQAVAV